MEEKKAFLKASWVNVIGNFLKIVVEGGVGLFFGSLALVADAAHSVADLLASVVVLAWGRLYYKKPDRSHPHGHERIEPLTALFVGTILVLIGCKFAYDASVSLMKGPTIRYSPYLFAGLGFGIVCMLAVYLYTKRINRKLELPSLRALAKDSRNDIYSSLAAIVGVVGVSFGFPILDPIAAGMVSGVIVYEGIEIGYENIQYLAGAAAPPEKQEEILETVRSHPETRGIHDFASYYTGSLIEVEMHVEIDSDYTLLEAHNIEADLVKRIKKIDGVYDAHIHLDPAGIGEWKEANDRRETESPPPPDHDV